MLFAVLASLSLAGMASAWAGEIRGVSVGNGPTGTRAEIRMDGQGSYKTLALSNPARLVVDFPASSAAKGLAMPAGAGSVASVRTGQPVPGTFRVVFDLANAVTAFKPTLETRPGGSTLVIEWPGDGTPARASAAVAAAPPPASVAPAGEGPAQAVVAREEAARATAALAASVVHQSTAVPPAPASASNVPASAAVTPVSAAIPAAGPGGAGAASAGVAGSAPANAANAAAILNGAQTAHAAPVPPQSAPAAAAVADATPEPPRPVLPSESSRIRMQKGMRPLVVAIDPGHGGQDPGATGPTGKHEKDVTLAIGRELARQINATPGLKAYMTRDTDVFIPLPMRARLARQAKADIFISIHADSAENRGATGSSVYVLSTKGASSQRARWLADKENAADLVGGVRLQKTDNTLANVLIDLAQSGHMKASEDAAGHVLGGLKRIGNIHKDELERANFAVLRTSDMPAMLVETAFISNPDEERRLTDPAFQKRLAGAVLDGINTFFTRQPPPGTLYAARAQAEAEAASSMVAGGSR